MRRLGYGLRRATHEIVGGFSISLMITLFSENGMLDPFLTVILRMTITVIGVLLFIKMQYWATNYLFGWFLGVIVLSSVGLVSFFEIVFYVMIPLLMIIWRLL